MSIEKGIYQKLASETTVTDFLGTQRNGAPCIFWSLQPQGTTLPALVLTVVYTSDVYSVQGASGFRIKRVQFDSYAINPYDSVAISDAVRRVFQSFQGSLPDDDSTYVQGCIVQNDMDFPVEMTGVKGPAVYRRLLEVNFQYWDTVVPPTTPTVRIPDIDGGNF
jgi:hypothetical protein